MNLLKAFTWVLTLSVTETFAQDAKLWDSERSEFFPIIQSVIHTPEKRKPVERKFETKPDAESGFVFTKPQTDWQSGTWLGQNSLLLDKNGFRMIIRITRYKGLESKLKDFVTNGQGHESIVQLDHLFVDSTQTTRVVRCQKLKGNVDVDEFRFIPIDSDEGILVELTIIDMPPYTKSVNDWKNHMEANYWIYDEICQHVVSLTEVKTK